MILKCILRKKKSVSSTTTGRVTWKWHWYLVPSIFWPRNDTTQRWLVRHSFPPGGTSGLSVSAAASALDSNLPGLRDRIWEGSHHPWSGETRRRRPRQAAHWSPSHQVPPPDLKAFSGSPGKGPPRASPAPRALRKPRPLPGFSALLAAIVWIWKRSGAGSARGVGGGRGCCRWGAGALEGDCLHRAEATKPRQCQRRPGSSRPWSGSGAAAGAGLSRNFR